ncbi:hypothetical protein, partial [Streptomyces sp. NPDC006333]|uniref:hypothetical protein n=1 Tax=Streptomyces sp. NPDC006333 TaxID=3156753 RepID=UPI0033AD9B67
GRGVRTAHADRPRHVARSGRVAESGRVGGSGQPGQKPRPSEKAQPGQKPRPKRELFQKSGELGEPRRKHPAAPTQTPRVPASADRAGSLVTEAVGSVVRPVADTVVRPVADTVVRPVGDLAERLTGELAASLPKTLPPLPALPAVPPVRAVPSLPSPPAPPGLLPPPSTGDGEQLPPADPDHPHHSAAPVPDPVAPRAAGREPGSATVLAYGPAVLGVDVQAGAAHAGPGHDGHHGGRGQAAGPAPARQAPAGDSSGAPGDRPAVDSGVSRHGDAHAVTPDHRAPLRLVSGTSEAVTAAGTRDRYRDIPLFPG